MQKKQILRSKNEDEFKKIRILKKRKKLHHLLRQLINFVGTEKQLEMPTLFFSRIVQQQSSGTSSVPK